MDMLRSSEQKAAGAKVLFQELVAKVHLWVLGQLHSGTS